METEAITKEKDNTATTVHTIEHADSELYKVGMYSTAIGAAAVGVWGLICLSSAILKNGGPVEMISNLFHSIFGV